MAFQISWYRCNEVIHLELTDCLTLADMQHINDLIMEKLATVNGQVALLVDASHIKIDYHTVNMLRTTQLYPNHHKMNLIITYAEHKLTRLVLLMAFSRSKAYIVQFDQPRALLNYLAYFNLDANPAPWATGKGQ